MKLPSIWRYVAIAMTFLSCPVTALSAEKIIIKSAIASSGYTGIGAWEILGEITNTSGKFLRGISVNVNYYDASGKLLKGSNFVEDKFKSDFSDEQAAETDYLAPNASSAVHFIRFSDKINGKVARADVTVTGTSINSNTAAVVEDVTFSKKTEYGVSDYTIKGSFKATAKTVFNPRLTVAGLDAAGKLVKVDSYTIDGVESVKAGQSVKFQINMPEGDAKLKTLKFFPSYRGDWDEN